MSFGDRPEPGVPSPMALELAAKRNGGNFLYGRSYEYWAGLANVMDKYGADAEEVERLLTEERIRQRTAAVLTIFDTALAGRSLGSLTSPATAARVVAENRDAIMEALR